MGLQESGDLVAHNRAILARARDIRPIEPMVRHVLTTGKRDQLLAGVDSLGRKFAPLKRSTLKRRKGNGPPLIPGRTSSRMISRYRIVFEGRGDRVAVLAGWDGLPWLQYHRTGTARMAKRDPGFFRERDREAVGRLMQDYVMQGRV